MTKNGHQGKLLDAKHLSPSLCDMRGWQLCELGGGKGAGMKAAVLPSFAAHAWVWAHASKTLLDIYEEMLELNRELKVIAQVIL